MFCPACGKQIPDGSSFCSGCGKALSAVEPTIPVKEAVQEETTPAEGAVPAEEAIPAKEVAKTTGSEEAPKKKKKSKKGCIIIGCGAVTAVVAVIAAIAVLIVAVFGGISLLSLLGDDSNAYAYLSDGSFKLVADADKVEIMEFDSAKSEIYDLYYRPSMSFSPDGKYLYYFSDMNNYDGAGTLCCAQYDKLKDNSTQNEKYILTVDDTVFNYEFIGDHNIVYKADNNTLFCFNGEDSVKIDSNVTAYYVVEDSHIVYTVGDYEAGFSLYGVHIDTPEDRLELADNVAYVDNIIGVDDILFSRRADDYETTYDVNLYVTGFNREEELLGNNAFIQYYGENEFYFTVANGESVSLYDYVTDTYREADAKAVPPVEDDYSTPYFVYGMIAGGTDLKESSYTELYTSCTKKLYWLGNSKYFSYSMEGALKEDGWGDNTAKLHTALQTFITKHGSKANEDGYILVTPEVKKDLQAIQALATDPSKSWQWLWLCYDRYQSGTDVDYNAYYEARDAYEETLARITLRDALQDESNHVKLSTLYHYKDGVTTPIVDGILSTRLFSGGMMYTVPDMITETIDLADMSHVQDARDLFNVVFTKQNYAIAFESGTVCRFSAEAIDSWGTPTDGSYFENIIFGDDEVFCTNLDEELLVAPIQNGEVGAFSLIASNAFAQDYKDSTLYYFANSYRYNSHAPAGGDLYSYKDGVSSLVADDILTYGIYMYEDGVFLAYTPGEDNSDPVLTMFEPDEGRTTWIDSNVYTFVRMDESTMLYIVDDDLYCFSGEISYLVDTDVVLFRCENELKRSFIGRVY